MKKFRILKLVKYLLLIAFCYAAYHGLVYYFSLAETLEYEAPLKAVYVDKARKEDIKECLNYTAFIEAENVVPIVSLVSGEILEYSLEVGQEINKDDVLLIIDDEVYLKQVEQAEAQVAGLEAGYNRLVELSKFGGINEAEVDTLKAQLDAANAQLSLAQLQASYTKIKAPVSGTVLQSHSSKGSMASPSSPLALVADLNSLEVNLKVNEEYYNRVKNNMDKIVLEVSTQDSFSTAKLTNIAPFVDPGSKTFIASFKLDNPEGFVPGMFVDANLILEVYEDVYVLDQKARKTDGSLYYLDGDIAKYLKLDIEIEDDNVFCVPDEYVNYTFITEGQYTVLDGEQVVVRERF